MLEYKLLNEVQNSRVLYIVLRVAVYLVSRLQTTVKDIAYLSFYYAISTSVNEFLSLFLISRYRLLSIIILLSICADSKMMVLEKIGSVSVRSLTHSDGASLHRLLLLLLLW